jgi:hypothetical protein
MIMIIVLGGHVCLSAKDVLHEIIENIVMELHTYVFVPTYWIV